MPSNDQPCNEPPDPSIKIEIYHTGAKDGILIDNNAQPIPGMSNTFKIVNNNDINVEITCLQGGDQVIFQVLKNALRYVNLPNYGASTFYYKNKAIASLSSPAHYFNAEYRIHSAKFVFDYYVKDYAFHLHKDHYYVGALEGVVDVGYSMSIENTWSINQGGLPSWIVLADESAGGFGEPIQLRVLANTTGQARTATVGITAMVGQNSDGSAIYGEKYITLSQSAYSLPSSGLKVHLAPDGTLSAQGALVSQWADGSGNANHAAQAVPEQQPLAVSGSIGNYPVIRFNGSSSALGLPATTSLGVQDGPYHVYIVGRSASSAHQVLLGSQTGGHFEYHLNESQGATFNPKPGTGLGMGALNSFSNGNLHLFSASASASGGGIRINGLPGTSSGADLTSGDGGALLLGKNSDGSACFNGDIAEVLVYNRVLSDLERTQLEGYLAGRYGLTLQTPPLLHSIESGQLQYTQANNPVEVTATLQIMSDYFTTLSGASVQIAGGYHAADDQLLFTDQNGISGVWDTPTGTLTLSGNISVANYATALRSIRYNNSNQNITATLKTVAFTVNALSQSSNTLTRDIYAYTEPGNALHFDGVNDYVEATDIDNGLSAFTIETWVKWTPTSATDVQFICGKGVEQMELHTGGAAGANGLRFIPTTGIYLDVANVLPTGQWTHVACVYDATNSIAKMYINGAEVTLVNHGAGPIGTAIGDNTTLFNLGRRSSNSFFFKGAIDELRVWNSARSAADIAANIDNTLAPATTGLIAYYNFNQGTVGGINTGNTLLPDITGNGNDGTLNNFALTGSTSNWVESYAMVVPVIAEASNQAATSFTANWTAPVLGAVDNYLLEVATDEAFTSYVTGYNPKTIGLGSLSENITGLNSGTTYYYRVRADKASVTGQGAYSSAITVQTTTDFTWSGSDTWDETAKWTPTSLPTANATVTVSDGMLSLNQNTEVTNLTINSGAVLIIAPNQTLSVTGTLTNNNGTAGLVIESDATGTGRLVNNTPDVEATAKQYISNTGWHYMGIPFAEMLTVLPSFKGLWIVQSNESEAENGERVGWTYLTPTDPIVTGKGYGFYHDLDTTITLAGTLFTGIKQVDLAYSGENFGWNMLANPYPCTADWDEGITKANIGGAVYVYNPATNNYMSYNNGTATNGGSRYIAPMQGFFVRANAVSGSVTFTNAAKTTTASTFKNATVQSIIRLELSDAEARKDESLIRLHPNATAQFDGAYDAYKLKASTSLTPQLYSVYNGEEYSINSIPGVSDETLIPLELMIKTSGQHTLALAELNAFAYAYPVLLLNASNEVVAYLESEDYNFTAQAGEIVKLFLAFSTEVSVNEVLQQNIFAAGLNRQIMIGRMDNVQSEVAVYNLSGQMVYHKRNVETNELTIPVNMQGVYVVKVQPEKGRTFVGKVVVK